MTNAWLQTTQVFNTPGRGCLEITNHLDSFLASSHFNIGLAHVFLMHTSASLMLCENADPSVQIDLETILKRLAPDGDAQYQHNAEGDDDMAAHVRSVLTSNSITIPIVNGTLGLGTWQGLYLYEHRFRPHTRKVVFTLQGSTDSV